MEAGRCIDPSRPIGSRYFVAPNLPAARAAVPCTTSSDSWFDRFGVDLDRFGVDLDDVAVGIQDIHLRETRGAVDAQPHLARGVVMVRSITLSREMFHSLGEIPHPDGQVAILRVDALALAKGRICCDDQMDIAIARAVPRAGERKRRPGN